MSGVRYIVKKSQILNGVRFGIEQSIRNEKIVRELMSEVENDVETILEDDCEEYDDSLNEKPKTGRWVKVGGFVTPGGDPVWKCSVCGKGMHVYGVEYGSYGANISDGQWVACPNCGAQMDI